MKRRLRAAWVAAAVLGVTILLAACGGGDDSSSNSSESSGTSSGSGELETVSFLQPVPGESLAFYPYMVGEELGFFEEEGVKVDYLSASSDLPLSAFVANGDADIADGDADDVLIATSKGGEFRAVFEDYRISADTISVLEDSDIQNLTELEGKTVGVGGQDDRVVVETALDFEGMDADSVQVVSVGEGGPTVAQALISGRIDAYAAGISEKAITEALGEVTMREILPEELKNTPNGALVVTPETLENKHDAIVGFIRAWTKATEVGVIDREVVEEIGRKRLPESFENEAIAQLILDISIGPRDPGDEPYGVVSTEKWEAKQDRLIAAGELKEPVDISAIVDESLIDEVNEFDNAELEAAIKKWREANPK